MAKQNSALRSLATRQTDMQVESMPVQTPAPLASEYGALVYEYEQLKPAVRERVKNAAIIIRKLRRRIIADILIMGSELIEIKAMLEHGKFLDWIEIEFKMSDRTARNYMYAAEQYGGKSEIISDLDATTVYLLAAPSTPNEARFEIEERIRLTGDLPTRDQIRIVIEAHMPPKSPKSKQLPPPSAPEPDPDAIEAEYTVIQSDSDHIQLTLTRSMARKLHVAVARNQRIWDVFTGEELDRLNIILSNALKSE